MWAFCIFSERQSISRMLFNPTFTLETNIQHYKRHLMIISTWLSKICRSDKGHEKIRNHLEHYQIIIKPQTLYLVPRFLHRKSKVSDDRSVLGLGQGHMSQVKRRGPQNISYSFTGVMNYWMLIADSQINCISKVSNCSLKIDNLLKDCLLFYDSICYLNLRRLKIEHFSSVKCSMFDNLTAVKSIHLKL